MTGRAGRSLRLLVLTRGTDWQAGAGGDFIYAMRSSEALARAGHAVTVAAPLAAAERRDLDWCRTVWADPVAHKTAVGKALRRAVAAAGGPSDFDAVIAHGGEGVAFALRRRLGIGRPLLSVVHLPLDRGVSVWSSRWRIHQRCTAAWADRVACVSRHQAGEVAAAYGLQASRLGVVGAAVEPRFFVEPLPRPVDAPLRLLIIGSVGLRKGHDLFVRTVAELARERAVSATVVGTVGGRRRARGVLALAEELGVADRIDFVGHVPHDRVTDYTRSADVFLFPSRSESFGLVVLEAMAAHLPCVVLGRASLPEVVGDAALVVDKEDPRALARAVTTLADPDEHRRWSERARRHAEAHRGWETVASRLVSVLEEIVPPSPA